MTSWIEVWIDTNGYGRLLLVRDVDGNSVEVVDPRVDDVVASFAHYDDADSWLTDEEFTIVSGRLVTSVASKRIAASG